MFGDTVFSVFRASVSEAGDEKREGPLKKYHVEKSFADRRYKVSSARTYFYLNEASCERNMDIFIRCLEAVAGEWRRLRFFTASRPLQRLFPSARSSSSSSTSRTPYDSALRALLLRRCASRRGVKL